MLGPSLPRDAPRSEDATFLRFLLCLPDVGVNLAISGFSLRVRTRAVGSPRGKR